MRILSFLFIWIIVWSPLSQAQVADTLEMEPIEVISTRYKLPVIQQPAFTQRIDSARLANLNGQSLGDALSRYSSIFVRSNAPGAISIASFRGLGGEQTRVLWEGMAINHSMLGLVDFSILRTGSFSDVEVSGGSASAMYGSGISGSVSLKSKVNTKEIVFGQSAGSNSNFITFGKAGFGAGNWSFGLSGSYQQNENDYRYFDRNTQQEENRSHAEFDNTQFQVQTNWNKEGKRFSSKFWYLQSDHEIPVNVFTGQGTARQYDAAYRWINSYNFRRGNAQHSIKTYLAQTELDYFDSNRGTKSLSSGREWNNEWQLRQYINPKLTLINVVSANLTSVETNNYSETKFRSVLSEQISLEWNPESKLRIFPAVRLDWYNDFGWAVSPSLGLNYQIKENEIYTNANIARNFRAPTFNDLYWPQGGNEDLDPETALKLEAGFGITDQFLGIGDHNLTLFRADISNGIRWSPGGSTFFQAQNYLSLLSYGVEWTSEKRFDFENYGISYFHSASYTRSTIDEARFSGDQAVGDQLPYVPKWKYSGNIEFTKSKFSVGLFGHFVSERFSTEQNELRNPEPSYFLADGNIQYSKAFNKTELLLGLRINNIFDEQYEVVRLYPQPLRHFLFTLTIKQKTN